MSSDETASRAGLSKFRPAWPGSPLAVPPTRDPKRALTETWLVLGVSLGASGIWSALSLLRTWLEALARNESLSQQSSNLNSSATSIGWLDFVYQIVGIALALVPVALAVYLLGNSIKKPRQFIGLDAARRVPDLALGALLAAVIGIPGLGLYFTARALGINTTVAASGLGDVWWAYPVLILAAAQNAVLEEVVMVGYLFTRWSQAGWGRTKIIVCSALIRGSYHLYQGLGGFVGNFIMGCIFGWVYTRTRRVLPLIIAHTILDVVSFVGYTALHGKVSWL